MGRPRKIQTRKVVNEDGIIVESEDVGVPGLFQPGQWDIDEEMQNNEALRQLRQEQYEMGAE